LKLEEIIEMWSSDCKIDNERLQSEIMRTPILHSKYWNILINERLLLERLKIRLQENEILLDEFFGRTLTKEELDKHGLVYSDKRYMKADIKKHIDVHPKTVEIKLKMVAQTEKIRFLEDCVKMIHGRSFLIKDIIAHKVWESGG
jgi:hypothetical protein